MVDPRPLRQNFVSLHEWAQAMKEWNRRNNVASSDIIKQWNHERKQS